MGNGGVLESPHFAVPELRTPSKAGTDAPCQLRCIEAESLVGFIAGHLTRRYACDGELEWINVIPERRGSAVASELLHLQVAWFVEQRASRICVDVDPNNTTARRFYKRHGAVDLNEHWLVWNDIKVALGQR